MADAESVSEAEFEAFSPNADILVSLCIELLHNLDLKLNTNFRINYYPFIFTTFDDY